MNRTTRLIHRRSFSTRHIRAINFSRRFVISTDDVRQSDEKKFANKSQRSRGDSTASVHAERLLARFDPKHNQADRLVFYQLTGKQYNEGEFASDTSLSDEEDNVVVISQQLPFRRRSDSDQEQVSRADSLCDRDGSQSLLLKARSDRCRDSSMAAETVALIDGQVNKSGASQFSKGADSSR